MRINELVYWIYIFKKCFVVKCVHSVHIIVKTLRIVIYHKFHFSGFDFSSSQIRTRDGWVRRANASSELSPTYNSEILFTRASYNYFF